MGDVYVARHTRLEVERAIKVIRADLARSPEFQRRFAGEARALAKLDHPNIVRVLDFGETEGVAYLVLELVTGGSLVQRLREPWTVDGVVRVLGPIAAALDYVHERQIVHGDVKPANILFRADGTPVLADFGIARDLAETMGLGRSYEIEGAPSYMASEQAAGLQTVPASDQYSLACVAYALLCGRVPFDGNTPLAVLNAHIASPPPAPRSIQPSIPPSCERALLRGLAKNPRERFPTAEAFTAALAVTRPALHSMVPAAAVPVLAALVVLAVLLIRGLPTGVAGSSGLAGSTPSSPTVRQAGIVEAESAVVRGGGTNTPLARPTDGSPVFGDRTEITPTDAPRPAGVATTTATVEIGAPLPSASIAGNAGSQTPSSSATTLASAPPTASRTPTPTPPFTTETTTETATPSLTPTPRATPTPTATLALTTTATPTTRSYPPPQLTPAVNAAGEVILTWSYAGTLASDEWFDVRVWAAGQPAYGIANVKGASYEIGANYPGGDYNWTIAVIRKPNTGPIQTLVVATPTLQFHWVPPGSTRCPAWPNC